MQLLNQFYWDTLGIRSAPKWHNNKKSVPCSNVPLLSLCFYRNADTLGPGQCELVETFLTRMNVGLKAAQAHQRGTVPSQWWQGCGQAATLLSSHTHTLWCLYTGTHRAKAASAERRCRHGPLALTLSWALPMGSGSGSISTQRALPLNLPGKDAEWHIVLAVDHGNTNQISAPSQWLLNLPAPWEIRALASGENC